mmetsp:Transcript_68896/g.190739  ORF Transcript_68896/g.190739 Transcript_68896/m.190739 type:complete len:270 (+) Transcript_68896:455-1264(+)
MDLSTQPAPSPARSASTAQQPLRPPPSPGGATPISTEAQPFASLLETSNRLPVSSALAPKFRLAHCDGRSGEAGSGSGMAADPLWGVAMPPGRSRALLVATTSAALPGASEVSGNCSMADPGKPKTPISRARETQSEAAPEDTPMALDPPVVPGLAPAVTKLVSVPPSPMSRSNCVRQTRPPVVTNSAEGHAFIDSSKSPGNLGDNLGLEAETPAGLGLLRLSIRELETRLVATQQGSDAEMCVKLALVKRGLTALERGWACRNSETPT